MPKNLLIKYKNFVFLLVILAGVAIFSLTTLTTMPLFFEDEGLTIELARNFMNYGKINLMISPGEFHQSPYLFQSTGYTMTILLAVFFKIFGLGLTQARILSLLLILVCLFYIYRFTKKFFGEKPAYWSILLTVSFPMFYVFGRLTTGEIFGFIFLLHGLFLLFKKNYYFYSGLWLSLAIVTKPSVYMHLYPAIIFLFLFEKKFLNKILNFSLGLMPAIFVALILTVPNFGEAKSWLDIINIFKDPSSFGPLPVNIIKNLSIWTSTPYFMLPTILLAVISASIIFSKKIFFENKKFFLFFYSYIFLALLYYLKSPGPGWQRYLFGALLLIFIASGPALEAIIQSWSKARPVFLRNLLDLLPKNFANTSLTILGLLLLIHPVSLVTKEDLFYSNESIEIIGLLNQQINGKSVGFINCLDVYSLALAEKRHQFNYVHIIGRPPLGKDFFAAEFFPDLVVVSRSDQYFGVYRTVFDRQYQLIFRGKYDIYQKFF